MFLPEDKCEQKQEVKKEVLIQSFFFYFFYMIIFFIVAVLSGTDAPCSMYQGMIIGATVPAIKCIPVLIKLNKILLIGTCVIFLLYPILNSNFILLIGMQIYIFVSIILFTRNLTKYI